jgi:subtilisin family serine protease
VLGLAGAVSSKADGGSAPPIVHGKPSIGPGAGGGANRLVVRFRDGVSPGDIQKLNQALSVKADHAHSRSGLHGIELPDGADIQAILDAYRKSGLVQAAGLDLVARAFDAPNDPNYPLQWDLHNTEGGMWAEGAWALDPNPGQGVTVAVIDTGVAYEQYNGTGGLFGQRFKPAPDLAGVPIVAPHNFLNATSHADDDNGHGTHVTGTIAQATNNNYGVAGIANKASIMPLKILDYSGSGSAADLVEAIYYAVDNGAKVINMSLGFSGTGSPDASGQVCTEILGLGAALDYAFNHGVVVVAASGNDGGATVACPAAYPTVIAVGATRFDGQVTYYSNQGSELDVTAPGGDPNVDQNGDGQPDGVLQETYCADFITLLLTGDYSQFCDVLLEGTSMASPHVAATAALLLGESSALTPLQVRYYIETTARDRGVAGWDPAYGWGALDATAALTALNGGPPPDITPTPTPSPTPLPGPAAPTNLVATALSAGTIQLTWTDNASSESGFKIERSSGGGSFLQIATVGADVTTYNNLYLSPNTTYTYRVRAYDSTYDSLYSNTATATTLPPPAAPSDLAASAVSNSSIQLTWTDNATTEAGYRVERSTDGASFLQVATLGADSTSYTSTNLSAGTTYYYRVRAYDGIVFSGYSNVASATTLPPPAAPSNLVATALSVSTIQLTWTDNSATESGFKVERSADGVSFSQIATVGAGVTTYSNLYLSAGTTYFYRVRAYEGSANSGYSNVASTTTLPPPAAPSGLAATALNASSIQLTWTDNATTESGYKVERSADGVSFSQIATVGANVTSYGSSNLSGGTTYYFRVRAYDGSANSDYSNVASATTLAPPAAPSNLAVGAVTASTAKLMWTDNSATENGFKIERSTDGLAFAQFAIVSAGVTAYTASSLAPATNYWFRVRAYEGAANGDYSNVATATTLPPPTAPSNLAATATGSASVKLTWTDNATTETGFKIDRSLDGASWSQVTVVSANTTTYTNTNLAPSTTYWYRVRAYDGTANGDYSNAATVTTLPPPAAPSNLAAVALTTTSVKLTWTDNSATESYFKVERSTDGVNWTQAATLLANTTSWTNYSLISGATYYFRVRAQEGTSVYSAYSNVATITMP